MLKSKRMRYTLTVVKNGKVERRKVTPRTPYNAVQYQPSEHLTTANTSSDVSEDPPSETNTAHLLDTPDAPKVQSSYSLRKEQEVEGWKRIRLELLHVAIEEAAPCIYTCTLCSSPLDRPISCEDCGKHMTFCSDCLHRNHEESNLHVFKLWTGAAYAPYYLPFVRKFPRLDHRNCSSSYEKFLTLIDSQGNFHVGNIQFCKCESECATLLRLKLWGATPTSPRIAVSTDLLDWLNYLTLECQVSAHSFGETLRFKNQLTPVQVRSIKTVLKTEMVTEYRLFAHETEVLSAINVPKRKLCPACPNENGTVTVALDANFGLTHRRKAGVSYEPPVLGSQFFINQDDVDNFLREYNMDAKSGEGDCNQFQAGDVLRSKTKNEKLDITAIFGCSCKHEVPRMFCNLRKGERIGYAVYLLKKLIAQESKNKVLAMYDIACVLLAHLKKTNNQELLDKVKDSLAIPIFHCYGHKSDCQLSYSPRRVNGFGLNDGEFMERLWSYLRKFSNITKEMTPSHRVDLLTLALCYYGKKKSDALGTSLPEKYTKADKVLQSCEAQMTAISNEISELSEGTVDTVTDQNIKQWEKADKEQMTTRSSRSRHLQSWEESYVQDLSQYFSLREQIRMCQDGEIALTLAEQYKKQDRALNEIEKRHKITRRWQVKDDQYICHMSSVQDKKKERIIQRLQSQAIERQFMLELKKKCRGQKTANRVSRQLTKTSNSIKKLIKQFNAQSVIQVASRYPQTLRLEEMMDATNPIYASVTGENSVGAVPWSLKRQAVELTYLQKRADEEKRNLIEDMRNVISCYKEHHSDMLSTLNEHAGENSRFCKGAQSLLRWQILLLEIDTKEASERFKICVPDITLPENSNDMILYFNSLTETFQSNADAEADSESETSSVEVIDSAEADSESETSSVEDIDSDCDIQM